MSKIVKTFSNPDVKPDFPKVDARTLEMGDGVKVQEKLLSMAGSGRGNASNPALELIAAKLRT